MKVSKCRSDNTLPITLPERKMETSLQKRGFVDREMGGMTELTVEERGDGFVKRMEEVNRGCNERKIG